MGIKLLIAHGDTQRLERAVRDLSAHGFEVVATPDGGDAFARFFEESPHLVICSENLPVLDGRSFARMIRSQTPDIPVILLLEQPAPEPSAEFLTLVEPLQVEAVQQLLPDLLLAPAADQPAAPAATPEVTEASGPLAVLRRFQRQGNLLALLDAAGLERMAQISTLQHHADGTRVIREGDPCDGFYLVVQGEVRVTLAERGDQEVARLGAGEFFGEMALLSDQPRSASVWTCGSTDLLWFERDSVLRLLEEYPELRDLLGGVAVQRAEENLWQALSEDNDVQRNLSGLLEGLDSPEDEAAVSGAGFGGEEESAPPVEGGEAGAPQGPGPLGSTTPVESPSEPPSPALFGKPESMPPMRRLWIMRQMARLFALRHQFGTGLLVGTLVGALVGVTLVLVVIGVGSEEGQSAATVDANEPEIVLAPTPTPAPERGEEPAGSDAPRQPGDPETLVAPPGGQGDAGPASAPAGADPAPSVASPPTEGPVPATATGDTALVPPPPVPTADRKVLRRKLFEAYRSNDFAQAVRWGNELRTAGAPDWEAALTMAHAERQSGDLDSALAHYLAFTKDYPGNALYADDASFQAAEILLLRGRAAEAKPLLKAVAADARSEWREAAEKRLANLKP